MDRSESEKRSRHAQLERQWEATEAKHHTSVPPEARGFLEASMHLPDPVLYPDEDTIADLMDWFVEDGLPAWKRCFARMEKSAEAPQRRRRGLTSTRPARPRVYGKTQAKRLFLLRFVAERVIPVANRAKRGFDAAGHSIPWEQVYIELKRDHPDYRGSAKALERAYRRAKSDQHVCELYFDGEFRNWAKQAEDVLDTLNSLGMVGLRPEDVFVKTIAHQNTRLLEDARQRLAEAQALRRANEVEGIAPATRKRNEARADVFEASAQTLKRASEVKEWSVISAKLPPAAGRALERAIRRGCGLTERFVAWPRGSRFCEGPRCPRCKVGSDLVSAGFAMEQDLSGLSAVGAGERLEEKLRQHTRTMRMLLGQTDAD